MGKPGLESNRAMGHHPGMRDLLPLPNQTQDPSRVVSFSDNVISVAITLLVFDVRVPDNVKELHLWPAICMLSPRLAGFLLSFSVIGVFWVAHNNMFQAAKTVNRQLMWLNNLFLTTVCLVPASAALLGRFPGQRAAVILYAINLIAVSLSMRLLWWFLARLQAGTDAPVDSALVRSGKLRMTVALLMAVLAIAVSFANPWISYAIFWITPITFAWSQFR
jgi:uncharacterized membrane protein